MTECTAFTTRTKAAGCETVRITISINTYIWRTASTYHWRFMIPICFDDGSWYLSVSIYTCNKLYRIAYKILKKLSKWLTWALTISSNSGWVHLLDSPGKRSILIHHNQYLIWNFEMSSKKAHPSQKWACTIFFTSVFILLIVPENDLFWCITNNIQYEILKRAPKTTQLRISELKMSC